MSLELAVHTHIWIVTHPSSRCFLTASLAVHTHIWIVTRNGGGNNADGRPCSSYPHMDCYLPGLIKTLQRFTLQFIPTYGLLRDICKSLIRRLTCSSYPHMDCYCNILCSASILNTISGAIQKTNMIIGSIFKKSANLRANLPPHCCPLELRTSWLHLTIVFYCIFMLQL